MAQPKGTRARIDQQLAKLRDRPREAEAGIKDLLQSDPAAVYRTALTVDPDDLPMRQLFAAADLDPADPFHWKKLVTILAALRSQRPGAPLRWGPTELHQLMIDVDRIHSRYSRRSLDRICEELIAQGGRYKDFKPGTLRRKFYDSFDEQKNPLLRNVLDGRDEEDWLNRIKKSGRRVKGAVSIRDLMRSEVIETIMTAWRKLERKRG